MSPAFTPEQEARLREIVRAELAATREALRPWAEALEQWDANGLPPDVREPQNG